MPLRSAMTRSCACGCANRCDRAADRLQLWPVGASRCWSPRLPIRSAAARSSAYDGSGKSSDLDHRCSRADIELRLRCQLAGQYADHAVRHHQLRLHGAGHELRRRASCRPPIRWDTTSAKSGSSQRQPRTATPAATVPQGMPVSLTNAYLSFSRQLPLGQERLHRGGLHADRRLRLHQGPRTRHFDHVGIAAIKS